ncbi:MAG TPA: protein kinase [Pyrinomonadaceae bacterium]|jgi:serine/threonine protein kinase|nr:protein kinase [Pyrinomonadaceae bacterium]
MITPERWQRVKAIFLSAQSSAPAERAAFLEEACDGDEVVRVEVESLLAADSTNDDFLSAPAYELAAEMLAEEKPEFVAGEAVGPYTILSLLGAGGMGEVYLAHDPRLDRKIALKVISFNFARDDARVRRFEQEARAASALNHPNVCVIHEVGRTKDGRHYMAMEFIDGVTLRHRMSKRKLTLKEVLDVAAQVALALEAAHAAGIVHRDIKPENIMVRRDGYVKVLDFGIAKLSAHSSRLPNVDAAAETTARFETAPGILVGTAKYMSPEQLRERPVDQRSDIWSLGVVLHELVTGFTPFEAHTTNETIAVILAKQPPQLSFDSAKVPEEFQQIVRKALSKERRERYQSISQLSSDLGKLRRHVSVEVADKPVAPPIRTLQTRTNNLVAEARSFSAVSTIFSKVRSQAIWTADYVLSEIKQHKTAAFMGATVVFVMLAFVIPRKPPSQPAIVMTMTQLTHAGSSVCAAISPDGKYVAHVEEKEGKQELLYTGRATASTSILALAADVKYLGVTFSRDGNYLYLTRTDRSDTSTLYGDSGTLYQVALPGGAPRKIVSDVNSPITFSPNGDRFSFVRFYKGEYSLVIVNSDGSGERVIAKRRDQDTLSVGGPAWSPDGETIICAAGKWDNGYHMNLIAVDVKDGHERVIGPQWFSVLQAAWLQDKSGLIISARERWTGPYQLWRVSYPQGEPVRITSDTNEYKSVSLASEGSTIVAVRNQQIGQLWVAPDGDTSRARAITSIGGRVYGLNWTRSGKIVYSAMAGNNLNISLIDPDGSNQTALTVAAGDNYTPATSADGRFIFFASNRSGTLNIWRMNAEDGSDPKQLTFTDGNSYPSGSSDRQWVVYDNQSKATYTLWKVPIEGGTPVQLSEPEKNAHMAAVSPDNQFVASRYFVDAVTEKIVVLPLQGGQPVRLTEIPIRDWQRVQWLQDGRALAFIDTVNGISNVSSYDLNSNSTKQVTTFNSDRIFAYAWSADYKLLACVRGTEVRDVMVMRTQP